MSTHCSRYPECGCPKEIGTKCHWESFNGQLHPKEVIESLNVANEIIINKPSELHSDILSILMKLPLSHPVGDCYDPMSAANDIEAVVTKLAEFCQKEYTKVKGKWVRVDVGIYTFGSENHYNKIANEHGKSFADVYKDFKNRQTN